MDRDVCQQLVSQRRNHPAWLLLASRNGPLTLACLKPVFENHPGGIPFDDAMAQLAEAFTLYANDTAFDVRDGEDQTMAARRELRQWLKRGLMVERDGQILATDALQQTFVFINGLQDRTMTSTASRLATVQREIENLEARLSPDQSKRASSLRERIALLENELAAVERGDFEVLEGPPAVEGIREVYQLAVSLRADFRRVEDSYRNADRQLRQRIVSEQHHRGEIVDELLAGHEALVQTPEGQVFESFHQQLVQTADLERMKQRLRHILDNDATEAALERRQKGDLRLIVTRLVQESERVIQARARSERDVRAFLKSGLADEQIRVGAILHDVFQAALSVDWHSQKVRRTPGPLPPIAVSSPNITLAERFLVKNVSSEDPSELDLSAEDCDLHQMDEEFWQAYHALDRVRLFEETMAVLKGRDGALTLGDLAMALPPTHDLETLAYWLAMAREAGIALEDGDEAINLFDDEDGWTQFHAPQLHLTHDAVSTLEPAELE